ncbi:Peptidoglycan-binding domain 1 protein [[Leptolyngbya] sp. PCC 7376]|uniref:peptidoglycan-binding domain-containing protein n=1 Tax=[Leptolyngbya] sp. PCC 7376 TaxID=111781 RepID=UPI00029F2514|nr:peptidoglycan-binding domain-containing protein [[Leptolyngbya] sp. PCC 7376]AFY39765.1 Peptidoglycan-binding domain 1 protein [[Leptolyngbya] sp. PCC 7376]
MKPNYGNNSAALNPVTRRNKTYLSCWYHPKLFSRVLSLCLVLFGNVIVTNIPISPVFAATACTTMSRGSQGDNVKALQQTLTNNGFDAGPADGQFGELTEIALKSFQRTNNLDPDGMVGPATCTALIRLNNSELIAAAPTPTTSPQPAPSGGVTATASPVPTPATPPPSNVSPSPAPVAQQPSPAPSSSSKPYQVVIPVRDNENTLGSVRSIVSGAKQDRTRLGTFVNAGNYSNRYEAESLSNALKARGFDARVVRR